jgi:hypothetical protein
LKDIELPLFFLKEENKDEHIFFKAQDEHIHKKKMGHLILIKNI